MVSDIRVKGAEYFQITVCPLPTGLVWGEIQETSWQDHQRPLTPFFFFFAIFQLLPSKKCWRKNETRNQTHSVSLCFWTPYSKICFMPGNDNTTATILRDKGKHTKQWQHLKIWVTKTLCYWKYEVKGKTVNISILLW